MILTAGTLGMLFAAPAFADDGITATADAPKMRALAQVEVLPVGSGTVSAGGIGITSDAAVAYGVSASFDYAVNRYLSIGVSPRLVLNVTNDDADNDSDADKQLDLRARLVGHVPVQKGLELYAALTPGYTFVMSSTDGVDSAKGFALGGAVGVTYDLSPRMFIGGEVGYQRAFTSADLMVGTQSASTDLDLSYMHIGLGAGTRF